MDVGLAWKRESHLNPCAQAFRDFTLHIVLETLPNQPRGYTPRDSPVFADNSGPHCLHLPSPPWSQSNPVRHQPNFKDGVDMLNAVQDVYLCKEVTVA